MGELFEALLELNKQMLLQNFSGNFTMTLKEQDFEKLALFMSQKYSPSIRFQNDAESLRKSDWIKIAGPGGYITVMKEPK